MKCKQSIALLLAGAMLLPANAFAADLSQFKDFPNDWSSQSLERAIDDGLLNGSNGQINAKGLLTRAQMAAIVARAFGAVKAASLSSYKDVLPSAWYYSDMGKAVQMQAFQGADGLLHPNDPITREEAFTVLARAFALADGSSSALSAFSDSASVSSWAKGSVAALVENGYVDGANGRLNPKNNITRAEFAKVITGMAASYVGSETVSGKTVDGNMIVRESGATLSNVTINGDLIIADSADKVSLENVKVTGRIVIRGGASSVSATNTTAGKGVLVDSPNGSASLSVSGGSIGTVNVKSDLSLSGTVSNVTITDKATLTVEKDAKVDTVTVSAAGAKVTGSGKVDTVKANANNVTVSTSGTKVTAGSGVSGVKAGDKTVESGKTETVGASSTSTGGSSGGGSSSSSSRYTYVLMNIPYDEFYKTEITNEKSVDAVSSATTQKSTKFAGSYYEETDDGVQIKGVKFPVRVLKSDLNSLSLSDLTEASDYYYTTDSTTPAVYKELTIENGVKTFSEVKGTTEAMEANVTLSTDTPWGDYLAEITKDGQQVDFGTVYAAIIKTDDGTSYGLRHLENIWLKNYEFAWSVGLKTSEPHGNTLNGEQYASMMGKTITEIDVVTATGIKTIATETYVPKKFSNSFAVTNALATAQSTAVDTTNFPADYKAKYTVKNAAGEEQTNFTVENNQLKWTGTPAIGAYTLTVSDAGNKYASYSASFELQTNDLPAQADDKAIVKTESATTDAFTAFVKAIKNVQIGDITYNASGRGAVSIIKADGTIDEDAKANGEALFADGQTRELVITATGYAQSITVNYTPTYTYAYAAVPYAEYWKSEGVYLEGTDWTASDATLDNHNETDKGAFDAVSRATTNHGLHRGSFQQSVVIHGTKDGASYDYHPVSWDETGNSFVDTDGHTYNKADIGITSYNITGIKYVPVKVKTSEFTDFCSKYSVTKNGETMQGGYSENNLSSYSNLIAAVASDTNGLKEVISNNGSYSFGKRQTGSGSGIQGQAQKTADSGIVAAARDYADAQNFGAHLRVDLDNTQNSTKYYGDLGSNMQTVVWKYYGDGDTVLATYGTKFAADDWMHKSMGIQLGLTDSKRFKLPEGTDGTGKWEITIYALGYSDSTFTVNMTADNVAEKVEKITDDQKNQLQALVDRAQAYLDNTNTKYTTNATRDALEEHAGEATEMLANANTSKAEAASLIGELTTYLNELDAENASTEPTVVNKEATLAIIQDKTLVGSENNYAGNNYNITVTVTLSDGTITDVKATSTASGMDQTFFNMLTDSFYNAFNGISAKEPDKIDSTVDAVSGATYSSATVKQAVKNALNSSSND